MNNNIYITSSYITKLKKLCIHSCSLTILFCITSGYTRELEIVCITSGYETIVNKNCFP